jgi:hexosaminidase
MRRLAIDEQTCPQELKQGLGEVRAERPERFAPPGQGAVTVRLAHDDQMARGLAVTWQDGAAEVRYAAVSDAFRAIGRLLGEADEAGKDFAQSARFDMLGVMADVSRNGVLTPDAVKALLRRCALMGINTFMLYSEDTYEVPGEPFFGYLGGRYTQEELRDLDAYAAALGVEMVPCIQTLAHLEQILQWPAYGDYRDVHGVLLAEEDRTYELVAKMIDAATAPFRSKRIHLGMDEAHGVGTGRYRQRHGEKRPFDVLNAHLSRVRAICRERGLEPMIWSDMYFRLGSKRNDYYDLEADIPPEVIEAIPKDVELVYWDYYHCEADFYVQMIEKHRRLGSEPVMAGGVWTWDHLWAALPFSLQTTEACMMACKQTGLRQAFVTLWGDDGMECDIFSALPGIQFFAEHAYADEVAPALLRANFRGSCEADFDDWFKAAELDSVPCLVDHARSHNNVSKWMLWQDPFLGLLDPEVAGYSLKAHYTKLADGLSEAAEKDRASERLRFPTQIARVLGLKVELRRDLVAAYRAGDRQKIRSILEWDLRDLQRETHELWLRHRAMWLATYKPFGLEVVEQRYGGLMVRLQSLFDRLKAYLDGEVKSIPEFETDLQVIWDGAPDFLPEMPYARAATPSCIK